MIVCNFAWDILARFLSKVIDLEKRRRRNFKEFHRITGKEKRRGGNFKELCRITGKDIALKFKRALELS